MCYTKKLFTVGMLLLSLISCGETIDFSRINPHDIAIANGKEREQSAKIAINPITGKKGLNIKWPGYAVHSWCEINLLKQIALPHFEQQKFRITLATSAACPVRKINLRIIDASGEFFQFGSNVIWDKAGSWTVEYVIDATKPKTPEIWGGNNDKKIDFPVKLFGISIDFIKNSGAGELYLDSIDFGPVENPKTTLVENETSLIILDPASNSELLLNQSDRRGQTMDRTKSPGTGAPSISVNWLNTTSPYLELNVLPAFKLPDFSVGKFQVKLSTTSASSVTKFSLRLIDRSGEIFQFEQKVNWDKGESRTLDFSIDTANPKPGAVWGGNKDKKIDFPVKVFGVAADIPKGSSGGLYLETINFTAKVQQSLTSAVNFNLETGHPIYLLMPGKEELLKLQLKNTVNAPITVDAILTIKDLNGKTLSPEIKEKLHFAPGEIKTLPSPKLPAFGVWYVNCRILNPDNANDYTDSSRSFAYMKPTGATPDKKSEGFIFGICSHPDWTLDKSIWEREALAMGLVGAKLLRVDMRWNYIEPEPGKVDYSRYDNIFEIFAKQGVEVAPILFVEPKWAQVGEDKHPEYNAWRNYLHGVFTRYKNKVRFYEVWNEPDILSFAKFDVPVYVELAKIAREELVKADSKATLLSAGFCNFNEKKHFHERAITATKDLFDIHAFHGHALFSYYEGLIEQALLPMRKRNNITMPWYANETALTATNYSEKEQAYTLFKKLTYSWSRGSVGYNWYDLRNDGYDAGNPEHNYGMLTRDFHPKAVYVAYNMLTEVYKGKDFVRQLPIRDGVWVFEFKDRNEIVFGSWSEDYSSQQLLIRSDAVSAQLIDLMGNAKPASRHGDAFVLPVSSVPITLRLTGATMAEQLNAPVKAIQLPTIIPGHSFALELELNNPLHQAAVFSLNLSAPPGLTAQPATLNITIPANSSKKWQTTLRAADDFRAKFGEPIHLNIDFSLNGNAYSGRVSMPVKSSILLNSTLKPAPDFILNTRAQVFSYFSADPGNIDKLWRSPEDLSAEIKVGSNQSELLVYAKVIDDQHVQPYSGTEVWQGDNIQIVIQIPGQNGSWELGLTRKDNGESETFAWHVPQGFDSAAAKKIKLSTAQNNNTTVYTAVIPLNMLGVTYNDLKKGILFNLLVNDNDGKVREGFIRIAPGIGDDKAPGGYPLLIAE